MLVVWLLFLLVFILFAYTAKLHIDLKKTKNMNFLVVDAIKELNEKCNYVDESLLDFQGQMTDFVYNVTRFMELSQQSKEDQQMPIVLNKKDDDKLN